MVTDPRALWALCADTLADVDFVSLRVTATRQEQVALRQGVLEPPQSSSDTGAMITVHWQGGAGYGATSNLTRDGLIKAAQAAKAWAKAVSKHTVVDFSKIAMPAPQGTYHSPVNEAWQNVSLTERMDLLKRVGESLRSRSEIIDSQCRLWSIHEQHWHFNSVGADIFQEFSFLFPSAQATAEANGDIQRRTYTADAFCRQGGWELLAAGEFENRAALLPDEAVELTAAAMCPTDSKDLLIAPDQMILQIHESIGHPIELDRILGDERNYAGTSFVTLDMFGSYQYGSELLNVKHEPDLPGEIASYGFDDDALLAESQFVIKDGILLRPLGGTVSQARAQMEGVANVRAQSWNRPPIDRMANLNVVPGTATLNDMISAVDNGILLRTNNSWSIDDSRNKFQFGCEWGQLIENGRLTKLVKQPNYRGVSAEFWRSLAMVGDATTRDVLGTPFCGKGEPNQVIRVGHASPACLFRDVAVFGGT